MYNVGLMKVTIVRFSDICLFLGPVKDAPRLPRKQREGIDGSGTIFTNTVLKKNKQILFNNHQHLKVKSSGLGLGESCHQSDSQQGPTKLQGTLK